MVWCFMRWTLAVVVTALMGCEGSTEEDGCATAQDARATNSHVSLGTDQSDCRETCASPVTDWPLMGVCAHLGAQNADDPPLEDAEPSEGEGGLSGTWDGTVTVRGARPSIPLNGIIECLPREVYRPIDRFLLCLRWEDLRSTCIGWRNLPN